MNIEEKKKKVIEQIKDLPPLQKLKLFKQIIEIHTQELERKKQALVRLKCLTKESQ